MWAAFSGQLQKLGSGARKFKEDFFPPPRGMLLGPEVHLGANCQLKITPWGISGAAKIAPNSHHQSVGLQS